jgi:hypothetical protein
LQGAALSSLLSLYGELVAIGDKKLSYESLLDSFLSVAKKSLAKQCYSAIAQVPSDILFIVLFFFFRLMPRSRASP